MKPPLMFLCHRIPYPPNKGDKIRSYNLLKHLAEHFTIYLGTFIDDPIDWDYVPVMEEICEDTCFIKLDPASARIKSVSGFLSGKPLSLPYYFSKELADWIQKTTAKNSIRKLIIYSSAMAQYAMYSDQPFSNRVIDFVDIDSDKWNQYSESKSWPMNWVYQREAELLLNFEKKVANEFDHSFFVSAAEADMFKAMSPDTASKVGFYSNGVDTDYFNPTEVAENPYQESDKVLVFTGAMDYWPNIDAVVWFSESVLPRLIEIDQRIKFYIVGGNPSETVTKLADSKNIEVTGRVDDIRPYIKFAHAAVAPMRIARGIQNKVLEAMAMECTVVTSQQGYEGITADKQVELFIANEVDDWISKICLAIEYSEQNSMGKSARARVITDYSWHGCLSGIETYL
ncbi:MAG: TIGR03087 family PEP-CTERM/XrtA system glycosyltransferase [Sedimenticola sp.]